MGYRKIKSNSVVMETSTGDLVPVADAAYKHWLTLNNALENEFPDRVQEILDALDRLDLSAIRPMLDGDTAYLETIKIQKATLKAELDTY